jgi:hypothetical protein
LASLLQLILLLLKLPNPFVMHSTDTIENFIITSAANRNAVQASRDPPMHLWRTNNQLPVYG